MDPHHPAGRAGGLLSTRGVTMLSKRQGPIQGQGLIRSETFGLNCLASFSAGQHSGTPGTRPITQCSCWCSYTSDCPSKRGINHIGVGPNRRDIPQFSSPERAVFETLESVQELLSQVCSSKQHPNGQHCMQETAQNTHRNATSYLHSLGFLFSGRRM